MSFKRILIAVDNEPVAAHAADIGMELSRELNAETALVYVIAIDYMGDTGISSEQLIALAEQEGKQVLNDFSQRLAPKSGALTFLLRGVPGTEIVKAAREWPADLIVIGSHGRSGMQRALLGSVAEAVMRHAPCPVLVVRAKD
jgi:nucleotide-binding universal stress UspA family protein